MRPRVPEKGRAGLHMLVWTARHGLPDRKPRKPPQMPRVRLATVAVIFDLPKQPAASRIAGMTYGTRTDSTDFARVSCPFSWES
jgi:hypothetical protein